MPVKTIGEIAKKSKIVETLRFFDEKHNKWLRNGFTQVGNDLLRDKTVSVQARFLYILLMSRLFGKETVFPGQEKLAEEMGTSLRSIKRLIQELKMAKWIIVKRRGQGKTNIYYLVEK